MAGLSAARALTAAGYAVEVYDKSGDIGGRLATRRRSSTSWNHGAPFVEARSEPFAAFLAELKSAGNARPVRLPRGLGYRGVPDMRELLRSVAEPLTCCFEHRVEALQRAAGGWVLRSQVGRGDSAQQAQTPSYDTVILALPAPQAVALLQASQEDVPALLRSVVMAPAWSLLLQYAESVDAKALATMDAIPLDGVVESITREGDGRSFVVRFGADWTEERLEWSPQQVVPVMLETLSSRASGKRGLPEPQVASAHRWRYAQTASPLGEYCLWDEDRRKLVTFRDVSRQVKEAA